MRKADRQAAPLLRKTISGRYANIDTIEALGTVAFFFVRPGELLCEVKPQR